MDRCSWFWDSPHRVSPDGFYFVQPYSNELVELASGRKIAFVGVEGAKLRPAWFTPDGRYLFAIDESGALAKDRPVAVLGLCGLAAGSAKDENRGQTEWLSDPRVPRCGTRADRRTAAGATRRFDRCPAGAPRGV